MAAPRPGLVDRLSPIGIAAIVAGVPVLFGPSAMIIPALGNDGRTSAAERAAPPADPPADVPAPSGPTSAAGSAAPGATGTPSAATTTLVSASFNTEYKDSVVLINGYEESVGQLINGGRRKAKCDPLRVDVKLRAAARAHAAALAARDFTSFAGEATAKGGDPSGASSSGGTTTARTPSWSTSPLRRSVPGPRCAAARPTGPWTPAVLEGAQHR